jgi:hypothetical protein
MRFAVHVSSQKPESSGPLRTLLGELMLFVGYIREFFRPLFGVLIALRSYAIVKPITTQAIRFVRFILSFRFSSALAWVLTTLAGFTVAGFLLARFSYDFAHQKFGWFVRFWDTVVLGLYSVSFLHLYWWMVVPAMVIALVFFVRSSAMHRTGGWVYRSRVMSIVYLPLYTLYFALAWQLQYYVWNLFWLPALAIGFMCHFLALLSIAILCCLTNRCPPINRRYIHQTRKIIMEDFRNLPYGDQGPVRIWQPSDSQAAESRAIKEIFGYSFFGFLVSRLAGGVFDFLIGKWMEKVFSLSYRGKVRLNAMKARFVGLIRIVSLATLFDALLRDEYYVMHFEMVLSDMIAQEKRRAWEGMTEKTFHPALGKACVPGLFSSGQVEEK